MSEENDIVKSTGGGDSSSEKIKEKVQKDFARGLNDIKAKSKKAFGSIGESFKSGLPESQLLEEIKNSRKSGEEDRANYYQKKALNPNDSDSNEDNYPKEGEALKQRIAASSLAKHKKNKQKLGSSLNPINIAKNQLSAFQASRNMIIREGSRQLRDNNEKKSLGEVGQSDDGDKKKTEENIAAELSASKKDSAESQNLEIKNKQKDEPEGGTGISNLINDRKLKAAWLNVLSTFTLSMLVVYLHVFQRKIFPKKFSKLGHEWVPPQIKKSSPEKAKEMGDRIGQIEKPITACCCAIQFIVLLLAIFVFLITPPMPIVFAALKVLDWLSRFFGFK